MVLLFCITPLCDISAIIGDEMQKRKEKELKRDERARAVRHWVNWSKV